MHDGELDDLRAQLEGSAAKVASLNLPPKYTVSRKTHLPDPRAYGAGPADWCTKRGRPYGLARSRHSDRLSQPCRLCFPEASEAAEASSETEVT